MSLQTAWLSQEAAVGPLATAFRQAEEVGILRVLPLHRVVIVSMQEEQVPPIQRVGCSAMEATYAILETAARSVKEVTVAFELELTHTRAPHITTPLAVVEAVGSTEVAGLSRREAAAGPAIRSTLASLI